MNFRELTLKGAFEIQFQVVKDNRGTFAKTFQAPLFENIGIVDVFKETYFSVSKKNVIRGMHFQIPPFHHSKLVFVTEGLILDVLLDIRKDSKTFGVYHSLKLHAFSNGLYIPEGFAHGFLTLSESATVVYQVSSIYNDKADTGILWNSFGFDWGIGHPILSDRDNTFLPLHQFNSPF